MLFFKKKTQGGDGAAWGRGAGAGAVEPGHRVLVHASAPPGAALRPCPPSVAVPVAHICSQLCSQPPPWELSRTRADGAGNTCASAQPAATEPGGARQGHRLPWDSADPSRSWARGGDPPHGDHGVTPGHPASSCMASGGQCVVGALANRAHPILLLGAGWGWVLPRWKQGSATPIPAPMRGTG